MLTTSFAQRGLVAEWGLSWLLDPARRPVPRPRPAVHGAQGRRATRPHRIGLVNRALPAEDVLTGGASTTSATWPMSSSPASMAAMKRQVYTELHAGLGAAERKAIELMRESFDRPDFAEGVKSFLERRPPEFPRLGAG